MAAKKDDKERIQQLRERRMYLAEERERAKKRAKFGPSVVAKINSVWGKSLHLDAFDTKGRLPVEFSRCPDFADCPGLVAANISEKRIREIIACCDAIVGPLSGVLGFDEYAFVGTTRVCSISLTGILDAAQLLHDSVLFCPDKFEAIALVDHYKVIGVPRDVNFSIVIQGVDLESKLTTCFESVVGLNTRAK